MEKLELLDVKIDSLFKRIFGEDDEIFINFANSVLKYPEEKKIKKVTFLNNEVNKDSIYDKESKFDVLAELNNGSYTNVEMQVRNDGEYEKRSLYYWAKLYERQLKEGENYRSLTPAICINILNFKFFKHKNDFYTALGVVDLETKIVFSNDFHIIFLEVPKVPKLYYNDLDMWMQFLKGITKKEANAMGNKAIAKAQETLEYLSHDPTERARFEARRKYMLDYNTGILTSREQGMEEGLRKGFEKGIEKGIEKGREEGEKQKAFDIAKNLRKLGLPIDVVIKATGFTAEELEKMGN